MSLVLNIDVKPDSDLNVDTFIDAVGKLPHFGTVGEGELEYNNPDTDVYMILGNEPVDSTASGFVSLDKAFIINYLRPEFFGLELFGVIESIAQQFDLYLDTEQAGSPQKFDRQATHKEWLKVNDGGWVSMIKENGEDLEPEIARTSRDAANSRWKFLYNTPVLQEKLGDVYIAKPFYIRSKEGRLVTLVSWPDFIPMAVPPGTDYVMLGTNCKKLFRTNYVSLGSISFAKLQEHFKPTDNGGLWISAEGAKALGAKLTDTKYDLSADELPGTPVTLEHILDAKA